MVEIRRCLKEDVPQVYKIARNIPELRVTDEVDEFQDEDNTLHFYLTNKDSIPYVAIINSEIIGFITGIKRERLDHYVGCIVYLGVIPEYRRSGIATKLFDACKAEFKKVGINYLYTLSDAESEPILQFVENMGFRRGSPLIWMDMLIDPEGEPRYYHLQDSDPGIDDPSKFNTDDR